MKGKEKDRYVLEQFIQIYCSGQHGSAKGELCPECTTLYTYAADRLARCRQDPKPSCKKCPVHCYRPAYRARIREVMRYSGKRLIFQGRLDLLWHYLF